MDLPPEVVARMEALVRRMAAQEVVAWFGSAPILEAREIVALLPEPVDAGLKAARELYAKREEIAGFSQFASDIRAGKCDGHAIIVIALAAYRAGQEAGK